MRGGIDEAKRPSIDSVPEDPRFETKMQHWNQHAQFTKLRFYVDSVHNKLHKGDESFYMQVQDGCVELRDRSRTAIKESRPETGEIGTGMVN